MTERAPHAGFVLRVIAAVLALASLWPASASAASLRLLQNEPRQHDFADLARLPHGFGRAEFTVQLWIKPDPSFPVGPVWRASKRQLSNWSDADPEPYSSAGWWMSGNWLIDGMSRPQGYAAGANRVGSFGLQFYGGGRLRWLFGDGEAGMPEGGVRAVQAWPADTAAGLLDGRWHRVAAVRRWRAEGGATLELWIDGRRVAATPTPLRTDMWSYWRELAHPDDPEPLGGWAIGSEVMTAWDYEFNQYEDYKGLVDEISLWNRALSERELADPWRVRVPAPSVRYRFDESRGERVNADTPGHAPLRLHKTRPESWSAEDAPRTAAEASTDG